MPTCVTVTNPPALMTEGSGIQRGRDLRAVALNAKGVVVSPLKVNVNVPALPAIVTRCIDGTSRSDQVWP